ncbi:isoprenylcysteine carboxyl methyltransferase [Planobispora rosea]|uniref:Isoprenylcysteine carboxyl methyltransferase n=1 Tax=Planobispora rosea TaxID=35762 RepID=A0A8J3RXC0_PLARO|nr:isoprenylcysteine carboxyl methyltransferase family protein [Planobispora rosea]GGS56499.1 isoprenylcysteine carboxyl methyltransferase [Planobispora rosea]GIH83542.1 isoprenylcysteine carboxyl methyltransferase [Planobispora rosea]
MPWYPLLVLLIAVERLAELVVSRRNTRWSLARGGVVAGRGHYPWMVALHTGLLAGCLAEVYLAGRPFVPALGWPMLVLVAASQALRWWCITTLGRQWNTEVIVVPGLPRVEAGPYRLRWLRHPNYVAVAVEGAALPLVHSAWITAAVFTVCNAVLMVVRIRCENAALAELAPPAERPDGRAGDPAAGDRSGHATRRRTGAAPDGSAGNRTPA